MEVQSYNYTGFDAARVAAFLAGNSANNVAPAIPRDAPVVADMFARAPEQNLNAGNEAQGEIAVETAGTTIDHVVDVLGEHIGGAVDSAADGLQAVASAGKMAGIGAIALGAQAGAELFGSFKPEEEPSEEYTHVIEEPVASLPVEPEAELSPMQKAQQAALQVAQDFRDHYRTLAERGEVEYIPVSERAEIAAELNQNDIALGDNVALPNQKQGQDQGFALA